MTQLILAYNFPAKHLAKLRMAAMKLGVKVRPVEKREYLQSLGSFVGTLGSFESVYDGENFPELMLVLCGFSQPMVNAFLSLLRASRLPAVPLKAVLTETNQGWNSLELHEELQKERPWNLSALQTLLGRLVRRGFLQTEKQGKSRYYTPLVTEEDYLAEDSRRYFQKWTGGSLRDLVACLYVNHSVTKEDLEELKAFIEDETEG